MSVQQPQLFRLQGVVEKWLVTHSVYAVTYSLRQYNNLVNGKMLRQLNHAPAIAPMLV